MLLRISAHADAEISAVKCSGGFLLALEPSLVRCASLIFSDAFYKFAGVSVSTRSRGESLLSRHTVTSERDDVVDAQKFQIVKLAFDLFSCSAGADYMRYRFDVVS